MKAIFGKTKAKASTEEQTQTEKRVAAAAKVRQEEAERKKALNEAMGRLLEAYDRDAGPVTVNNQQLSLHEVDPTMIWDFLVTSQLQRCESMVPVDYTQPRPPNHVRFVCLSDTHDMQKFIPEIPNGDVLLHAGDFSMSGRPDQVELFNAFIKSLPHPHKIVIAGNHELTFHRESYPQTWKRNGRHPEQFSEQSTKGVLRDCTYLEDSSCVVSGGLTVYGSPWQPEFCGWAFNLDRGPDLKRKWAEIGLRESKGSGESQSNTSGRPGDIDVLITHGPPLGFGDRCVQGHRAGCYDLLKRVQHLRPKYHVFGHIHEGYGQFRDQFGNNYINASIVDEDYNRHKMHPAIVFDLPCRPGFTNTHPLEPLVFKQQPPRPKSFQEMMEAALKEEEAKQAQQS